MHVVIVTSSSRRRFELLYLLHKILCINFDFKLTSPLIVYLHLTTTHNIPDVQYYFPGFDGKRDTAGCAANYNFQFLDRHH